MEKIKTIIVDDEPLAIEILEGFAANFVDLDLVAKCSNAIEASKTLKEYDVDLMFLDIQMPRLTGVDFLRTMENPPMTVFTTAYSEYAIEGFELDAMDYLLKPISFERFATAVKRVREKFNLRNASEENIKPIGKNVSNIQGENFMYVKADKKLVRVNYDDVLYVEGLKDYVIIRMKDGRIVTLQTMKSLEEKLPNYIFKRVHRSYIVNMNNIEAVMGNTVELKENGQKKQLPVGKNYRDNLHLEVNKFKL